MTFTLFRDTLYRVINAKEIMDMYTCFFIGHRDAPSTLQQKLDETVDYLWRWCGVTQFVVGHHGNFDNMAVSAVEKAKEVKPELYAYLLMETFMPRNRIYLPGNFDNFYVPGNLELRHPRYAIEKVNRAMLRECDYLVAYVSRDGGNAAKILRSAKHQEKDGLRIINLATDNFPPK